MSCAYRHAATRIATIAGIPPDVMLTAMDIARQRRVTFPALPPDRLRTIAPLLGITPTCGNPQQVIARIQSALIALGTLHATNPWVERWVAIAAALLGVPEDHLPVPVHPVIMATVRAQWAAPPRAARSRRAKGLAALWRGEPIPAKLIDEARRNGDRMAIVTWIAHGVWDERFTDVCRNLTDEEIGTIARAGVVPDALVERVVQRWGSDDLPWDIFPLTLWDRVADPDIAREGRSRTAAMRLICHPTIRDDRLMIAAAETPWYAHDVLIARPDLRTDECLLAAVAPHSHWAAEVLKGTDICDDRLIDTVANAEDAAYAARVLIERPDLHTDNRLLATVAAHSHWAARVLQRTTIRDDRLIIAATATPSSAHDVLIARPDLRTDECLLAAVAAHSHWAAEVLKGTDICDDRLIDTVANAEDAAYAARVLIARADLRTDGRLLAAIARYRNLVDDVLTQVPDLRNHPLLAAVRPPDGTSA